MLYRIYKLEPKARGCISDTIRTPILKYTCDINGCKRSHSSKILQIGMILVSQIRGWGSGGHWQIGHFITLSLLERPKADSYFILSNARRFYSSKESPWVGKRTPGWEREPLGGKGSPLGGKGLNANQGNTASCRHPEAIAETSVMKTENSIQSTTRVRNPNKILCP